MWSTPSACTRKATKYPPPTAMISKVNHVSLTYLPITNRLTRKVMYRRIIMAAPLVEMHRQIINNRFTARTTPRHQAQSLGLVGFDTGRVPVKRYAVTPGKGCHECANTTDACPVPMCTSTGRTTYRSWCSAIHPVRSDKTPLPDSAFRASHNWLLPARTTVITVQ